MARLAGIQQVASEKIKKINEWWLSKKAGRPLPDRADVDPSELKSLLPYILISDFSLNPFRVRYRLIGTRVVDVSGFNFAGRYLDELIPPDMEEPWSDHYRSAFESRSPVFGETTVPTIHLMAFKYEFGIFPLTCGGESVAQFLAIEDYGTTEPRVQQLISDLKQWKDHRN